MTERKIIRAKDLKAGDRVTLPGWMLHEDLSGLRCELIVEDVSAYSMTRQEPGVRRYVTDYYIDVVHSKGRGRTWFKPDELVEVFRTEEDSHA